MLRYSEREKNRVDKSDLLSLSNIIHHQNNYYDITNIMKLPSFILSEFNSCSEFLRSPERPVSQIYSPHLHVGAPGIFSVLLRSVQMLKREWVEKATGSYCTYLSLVKLQPWFLRFQWKTCLWTTANFGSCVCSERFALGQNTLMMMMMIMILSGDILSQNYKLHALRHVSRHEASPVLP